MNVYEDIIIKELENLKEAEPDLQYDLSHSQFMKQPSKKRDKLVESVLKYIKKNIKGKNKTQKTNNGITIISNNIYYSF